MLRISAQELGHKTATRVYSFCGDKTDREKGPKQSNVDHAIPKKQGGNNSEDNAQNTCRDSNLKKGAKSTEEFLLIKKLK